MIAYFDDSLGSTDQLADLPATADAVVAALEVCEEGRECLIKASKAVIGLYSAAAEAGNLQRQEELRQLRIVLWESRALIEARIIALRQAQRGMVRPAA